MAPEVESASCKLAATTPRSASLAAERSHTFGVLKCSSVSKRELP